MVRSILVAGLGVLTLALAGCTSAPPAPAAKSAPAAAAPANKASSAPKAAPKAEPTGQIVEIGGVKFSDWGERDAEGEGSRGVDAGDFYFKGTFLRGEPGQKLTLRIKNVSDKLHNFSLPEQGIDMDLPPGDDRHNVEVTFPDSGGVRFFSKYSADQGMNGLLLVGDATPESVMGAQRAASPQPGASPKPAASPSPQTR